MPKTFYRDRFTWLAYILLAFYAYYLNILGPITPFLKDELGLSYTVSSLHFSAFAFGLILLGLGGQPIVQRFGPLNALWAGALSLGLGAIVLLLGQTAVVTIAASFMMGVLGSLILIVVPAALSNQHPENRAVALSESNVIAALVSTAAPLMVGLAHSMGNWRLALAVPALFPVLLRIAWRVPAVKPEVLQASSPTQTSRKLPVLYWLYWITIVLAVSIEFCMVFWAADYLGNSFQIEKGYAAQAVSLFLLAMILGRALGSRIVNRFETRHVVFISVLITALGFAFFWLGGQLSWALLGLFITGFGVANLYPLILSLAIGAAKNNAVQASARATLASGTAILALPLVLGRLADLFDIQQAYSVVAVLLVLIVGLLLFTNRFAAADQRSL